MVVVVRTLVFILFQVMCAEFALLTRKSFPSLWVGGNNAFRFFWQPAWWAAEQAVPFMKLGERQEDCISAWCRGLQHIVKTEMHHCKA